MLSEGVVRSLTWKLLNPRSNRRGPWDRNDPFIFVDHDIRSSVDTGPAVLKRHSQGAVCPKSGLGGLEVMAYSAGTIV